jgi:hypothetical protein
MPIAPLAGRHFTRIDFSHIHHGRSQAPDPKTRLDFK